MGLAVLLIAFGAPETAYERVKFNLATPRTAESANGRWALQRSTKQAVLGYLGQMRPWSFKAAFIDSGMALQAPRALIAPTTLLLTVVSVLPYVTLWGLGISLSLLFSPLPFLLSIPSVGALLTGPFLMGLSVTVALALPMVAKRFRPSTHISTIGAATVVASSGILAFGLYIEGCMHMPADGFADPSASLWTLDFLGAQLSLPLVSFLLGLIAAGSVALDSTAQPMIQRSTAFTSSNLTVCLRNTADMNAGVTFWRNLIAGAFVLGMPNAVWDWDGLKSTAIAIAVVQFFIAGAVSAVWWAWEENVRRLDGRIMGLVDLSLLKKQASFFDTS